ncbi:hypothetical protein F5B18DRAFT_638452, partial [Nemania serpens]
MDRASWLSLLPLSLSLSVSLLSLFSLLSSPLVTLFFLPLSSFFLPLCLPPFFLYPCVLRSLFDGGGYVDL